MSFSENTEKEILVSDDELILDEIIPVEEDIEEPEKTGRDISIELKETVGLSSP